MYVASRDNSIELRSLPALTRADPTEDQAMFGGHCCSCKTSPAIQENSGQRGVCSFHQALKHMVSRLFRACTLYVSLNGTREP